MAEILQVSRTSVREALRVMEIMGIIQINVGKGIFVGDLSTQSMAQAISSSIMFEQKNIEGLQYFIELSIQINYFN